MKGVTLHLTGPEAEALTSLLTQHEEFREDDDNADPDLIPILRRLEAES